MFTTVRMVAPAPGNPPKRARNAIADSLAYEFPVGLVSRFSHIVGHDRGQERIYGAQERQGKCGKKIGGNGLKVEFCKNPEFR